MNEENKPLENTSTNIENNTEPTTQEPIKPTVSGSTEVLQPVIEPTVEVPEAEGSAMEFNEKPHDIPIPENNSKKDFVIKSKKETVAEEVKLREKKIEEHVKQANANYKPNSKATNFFLVFFLIFIIAFTIFLPQIHNFVNKLKAGDYNKQEEVKIENGNLDCVYEKSSSSLDYKYEYKFKFSNNLLDSYYRSTTTKGDASLDLDTLNNLKENCKIMKSESASIAGIDVLCESESNSIKVTEKFDLSNIKSESLTPAYTEAGGGMPEYALERDMDDLEKNMKAAGFTCERVAS